MEAPTKLYDALMEVQKLKLTAKKDTEGYNYKYADLEEVWNSLSGPLKNYGLVVIQTPQNDVLQTSVIHVASGQSVTSEIPLMTSEDSKNHMQDLGAAITYARRYALCSMFNIITNDDDNNSNTTEKPARPVASTTSVGKPSEKQINFARALLQKAGYSEEAITARLAGVKTGLDAKLLIEKLLHAGAKR
jgi:hypothetical protein